MEGGFSEIRRGSARGFSLMVRGQVGGLQLPKRLSRNASAGVYAGICALFSREFPEVSYMWFTAMVKGLATLETQRKDEVPKGTAQRHSHSACVSIREPLCAMLAGWVVSVVPIEG